jgi:hypothetical protein
VNLVSFIAITELILTFCFSTTEMLPPLWFHKFPRLRHYFGDNYYIFVEKLVILLELDADVHAPFEQVFR